MSSVRRIKKGKERTNGLSISSSSRRASVARALNVSWIVVSLCAESYRIICARRPISTITKVIRPYAPELGEGKVEKKIAFFLLDGRMVQPKNEQTKRALATISASNFSSFYFILFFCLDSNDRLCVRAGTGQRRLPGFPPPSSAIRT